jgi:hypothetical protein
MVGKQGEFIYFNQLPQLEGASGQEQVFAAHQLNGYFFVLVGILFCFQCPIRRRRRISRRHCRRFPIVLIPRCRKINETVFGPFAQPLDAAFLSSWPSSYNRPGITRMATSPERKPAGVCGGEDS